MICKPKLPDLAGIVTVSEIVVGSVEDKGGECILSSTGEPSLVDVTYENR